MWRLKTVIGKRKDKATSSSSSARDDDVDVQEGSDGGGSDRSMSWSESDMSDCTQHAAGVHVIRKGDDGDDTFIMMMQHQTREYQQLLCGM